MNFKIAKRELSEALNLCNRAIASNTPLPSLAGIKITVSESALTLIASDSNISIRTAIKNDDTNTLTVYDEGEIILDAKYLTEMVRKLDDEIISFETIDGTWVRIYSGSSEYKINGMRAFEYPEINFDVNTSDPFTLETALFGEIIDQTAFACSDKETKPVLTGVNFRAEDRKLYVNATDSFRLASKTIELDRDLHFNITVPAKYLIDVYHGLAGTKEVTIAIDSQKISFSYDDTIIQTRLLDDAFPDTSRLMKNAFTQVLVLDSRKFLNAISMCSFIKSDGKNIIKLSIAGDKVEVSSLNQAVSLNGEIDVISFEGSPLEISCSGKYLEDAVKALRSEEVTLCFSGELKPIILKNGTGDDIIQLISPVRTYR